VKFDVWAPLASTVDLVLDGCSTPMRKARRGHWSSLVEAEAGARYGYRIDGGAVRPDPRSESQPDGVEGTSEVVEHGSFVWTDGGWRGMPLRGAVLYELHVGTFTPGGTFASAIEKLPHLVDLGVDAVELMPVHEFPGGRGWGYDCVNLFAPHHAYGGPEGLKRFVDACHSHGLGVVVDVVYNHFGPSGNHLPEFAPYLSQRHVTNWGAAVNFDGPGSDEVRRFVLDNALMWLRDYHADGLRLDAVHAIVDTSARHILEELADEVDALAVAVRRPLFVIAESDLNDPRFVRSTDAGGFGLDASWADEWHHALHAVLTEERSGYYEDFGSLALLGKAIRQAWVYDGTWSSHRMRHHGRRPDRLAGHRFVVFTQNHDQVGNRMSGERSGALMSDGRLRVAAALLFCTPFTPMLFQGEEWGASSPFLYFTDHRDPEVAAKVSEGRRSEFTTFGWDESRVPDPQDPATFEASKLDWGEPRRSPHSAIYDWYRQLVCLRRRVASTSDPRTTRTVVEVDERSRSLVVTRGTLKVLVNLGCEAKRFEVPRGSDVLAFSDGGVRRQESDIVVPADAVVICECDPDAVRTDDDRDA
jgi:maltooligosyltrehalose trehalohydrolase